MNKEYMDNISLSLQKQLLATLKTESLLNIIKKYIKSNIKKNYNNNLVDAKCFFWINGQYAYGLIFNHSKSDIKTLVKYYDRILLLYNSKMINFDKPDTLIHAFVTLMLYSKYRKNKYLKLIIGAKEYINNEYNENEIIRYRIPINKFYIDALGMINSFCYEYSKVFKDHKLEIIADRQLDFVLSECELHNTILPYHVYNLDSKTHSGPNTWGRGIGWFLIGLTEAAINNPLKYGYKFNEVLDYVFIYQNDDGFFYDDFVKKAHIDTSITSMAALSLAKGLQFGLINKDDIFKKKKKLLLSIRALIDSIDENGFVLNSSGECNEVGDYSVEFGNFFAQGYTLALFNIIPKIFEETELYQV